MWQRSGLPNENPQITLKPEFKGGFSSKKYELENLW